jgi:galacturan 1,4-alpha-galacturonidase
MRLGLPVFVSALLALPEVLAGGYNGPKSCDQFRQHHPYHHPPADHRPKVYIKNSKSDTDDISAEFYAGLKKANHGGTLVLPKGKTFVIGKKLDLTFLDDIQVQLDGEILVSGHHETIAM